MRIVSINIGKAEQLNGQSFNGATGIFKRPISTAAYAGALGFEADAILDTKYHGGVDQALYLYRQEDYDWWANEINEDVGPGVFGDNITVEGLQTPGPNIGSRLLFDEVVLEVTAPRIPCSTLAARMGDVQFVKRFIGAERPGFYCRVITEGTINTGDPYTFADYDGDQVSIIDLYRSSYRKLDADALQKFLDVPIDQRNRAKFELQLEKLNAH